jgi:hypothetical protein
VNVFVSREAEDDILDAIAFYDSNGKTVGDYFLRSIIADVHSLSIFGGIHSIRCGYHCMAAKRFPFAVYYSIVGQSVYVVAVLDERRSPEWILDRLKRG